MTRKLVALRLRSIAAGFVAQARKKGGKGNGMVLVLVFALLYACIASGVLMGINFYTLAEPYHIMGLDWLYFSIAGLMALGCSVIGSVFTTQSQLYDAKDNALLLSMPIPPGKILMSRMIPLLLMNLLFTSIIMVPAMIVYGIWVEFRIAWLLAQLLAVIAIVLFSQAVSCIFGWLLHQMLSRLNKSVASILYLAAFLGIYFYIVGNAQNLLSAMIGNSEAIAATVSTWVWPLYAMGQGSIGSFLHALVLPAIAVAAFGVVYLVLSATFLKNATRPHAASKRRTLDLAKSRTTSPTEAIIRKEMRRFLLTPIYLTNSGFGILMLAVMTVAGALFRSDLLALLNMMPGIADYIPLVICGVTAFMVSTIAISTPSVSLESKSIWILKSMPVRSRDILLAKLAFHCRLSLPMPIIAGGVLSAVYGCGIWEILLCAAIPGLLALFNGILGMVAGLKWAQLDYISEAYPCKQSVSILISMLGTMGVAFGMGACCVLTAEFLPLAVCMAIVAAGLIVLCCVFYRILITWGPGKWDSL